MRGEEGEGTERDTEEASGGSGVIEGGEDRADAEDEDEEESERIMDEDANAEGGGAGDPEEASSGCKGVMGHGA